MKKELFFISALAISLSIATPVFAQTDKEITFRDIPWGTNFNDTCKLLPEFDLFGNTQEGLSAVSTNDVLKGKMYGDYEGYDGAVCFHAIPPVSPDIDVAGYPIYNMYLYYTYSTENDFSLSDDNTILYGAQYEFEEPQDLESMYSDLIDKLSKTYGEPDDTYDNATDYLAKGRYTCWYGANDTAVALQSYDYGDESSVYISYAWLKGDELLGKANAAFSDSEKSSEAEIYGNGSTNGL
jgi:hypothetical protein